MGAKSILSPPSILTIKESYSHFPTSAKRNEKKKLTTLKKIYFYFIWNPGLKPQPKVATASTFQCAIGSCQKIF